MRVDTKDVSKVSDHANDRLRLSPPESKHYVSTRKVQLHKIQNVGFCLQEHSPTFQFTIINNEGTQFYLVKAPDANIGQSHLQNHLKKLLESLEIFIGCPCTVYLYKFANFRLFPEADEQEAEVNLSCKQKALLR